MRINVKSPGVRINVGETNLGSHGSDSRYGAYNGGPYKPITEVWAPPPYTIEVVDTSDICTYDPTAMTLVPNGSGRTGTIYINVAARGSKFVTVTQLDVALVSDDLGIPVSLIPLPPVVPAIRPPALTMEELEKNYTVTRKPLPPKAAPVGPVNRRVGKPDLRPLPFIERRYSPIDLRKVDKAVVAPAYAGPERRHGALDTRPLPRVERRGIPPVGSQQLASMSH